MSNNETFKAELKKHLKTFKKSYDLCGVEFVYIDPEYGKTTRRIQASSPYAWEEYGEEILKIIETCEIVSYTFLPVKTMKGK